MLPPWLESMRKELLEFCPRSAPKKNEMQHTTEE